MLISQFPGHFHGLFLNPGVIENHGRRRFRGYLHLLPGKGQHQLVDDNGEPYRWDIFAKLNK